MTGDGMSEGPSGSVWSIAWPLLRLGIGRWRRRDPWHAVRGNVPLAFFGVGCRREFEWYLGGPSAVRVQSVAQLCAWLAGCAVARDDEHFGAPDVWQHPAHFEERRRGDCEDHALWAWRKLLELGHQAEFVSGEWTPPGAPASELHGWVVFTAGGERFVLEAVACDADRMVRPLAEARREYVPHFSVDHQLRRWVHAGLVDWMARGWLTRGRRAPGRASRGASGRHVARASLPPRSRDAGVRS
jgi:hypothetical protein